jgi:peptidoglycan/xylan/chitin deacetylase (PgdA/CDA1 family)
VKLRLALFLTQDSPRARQTIAALCKLDYVTSVAVFLIKKRTKTGALGQSGPLYRLSERMRGVTDRALTSAVVSRTQVRQVLQHAFSERYDSLEDLAAGCGITLYKVHEAWSAEAVDKIGLANPDLGVSLERVNLPQTAVRFMRLGCIYCQKGQRSFTSMPAGFWELYDGASAVEVDISLAGDSPEQDRTLARNSVPISHRETPDTLQEKLEAEGERLLLHGLDLIRHGQLDECRVIGSRSVARPEATKQEIAVLRERLPHWKSKSPLSVVVRNLYTLAVYYSGVYVCVRLWRRGSGRSRAAIFLYHRVNGYAKDVLTVDPETFAAQLLAISARYQITNSSHVVECIRHGRPLKPTTVAIHFDDNYQDVVVNGAPILRELGIPACAFLNSGYIDTTREYPHDIRDSPFRFNKLTAADVLEWVDSGCEVGAHTVNHIDLGDCPSDVAYEEARLCGSALENILHRPVKLFAFPYGRPEHLSDENRQAVERAEYQAIFSCDSGFIDGRTKTDNIPRLECFYEYAPLHCLLQIEGITLHQLAMRADRAWRKLRKRSRAVVKRQPILQHSRN